MQVIVIMLSIKSTSEVAVELAGSLKIKRKWLKHSRIKAAELSGVPAPTIRRFENTGEISLRQLLMLCQVYDDLTSFQPIFAIPEVKSINELIKRRGNK